MDILSRLRLRIAKDRFIAQAALPNYVENALAGDGLGNVFGFAGTDLIIVRHEGQTTVARNLSGKVYADGDPIMVKYMSDGREPSLLKIIDHESLIPVLADCDLRWNMASPYCTVLQSAPALLNSGSSGGTFNASFSISGNRATINAFNTNATFQFFTFMAAPYSSTGIHTMQATLLSGFNINNRVPPNPNWSWLLHTHYGVFSTVNNIGQALVNVNTFPFTFPTVRTRFLNNPPPNVLNFTFGMQHAGQVSLTFAVDWLSVGLLPCNAEG